MVFYLLLFRQDHVLPPSLPEQMAVRGDGARKHAHRQHRVVRPVGLRHHVEQGHRTVSFLSLSHSKQCKKKKKERMKAGRIFEDLYCSSMSSGYSSRFSCCSTLFYFSTRDIKRMHKYIFALLTPVCLPPTCVVTVALECIINDPAAQFFLIFSCFWI